MFLVDAQNSKFPFPVKVAGRGRKCLRQLCLEATENGEGLVTVLGACCSGHHPPMSKSWLLSPDSREGAQPAEQIIQRFCCVRAKILLG